MSQPGTPPPGIVYLVGAGPGDPRLITLRGVECLKKADLVLYDYLVNPQILSHACKSAELVCLGRHGKDRILSQAEVNERMLEAASQGRNVVRLKGGDPIVFARLAEEVEALQASGIRFEVVPGITAALAAGSYAGIPLTHRDLASAVALVTGHEQEGKAPDRIDYQGLAAFPGTLVFYMAVTTARDWSERLIGAGKAAATPAAIIRRVSWSDQSVLRCTLSTVADVLESKKVRPPALVIIGEVASIAPIASWFTQRPMFGQRILVTRPQEQSAPMVARLTELGAECMLQPVIHIGPPADWNPIDAAIESLDCFDWVVFSSANGVQYFLDRLLDRGYDARKLGLAKLAAIGPGTAEKLREYRLNADLQPAEYRAESLADALNVRAAGARFLLIRASRGREVLAEGLVARGGKVEQVVAYASTDIEAPDPENALQLAAGKFDWVTVTSSAIARSLLRLFGEDLRKCKLASISPVTSGTLRELGFVPAVEAIHYTGEGLVQAVLNYRAHQTGC